MSGPNGLFFLSAHPNFHFLNLFLSSLESNLLRLIQTHLQVFDGLLHVPLHPLQVTAGVLLLLQLLRHHGCLMTDMFGYKLQYKTAHSKQVFQSCALLLQLDAILTFSAMQNLRTVVTHISYGLLRLLFSTATLLQSVVHFPR